MQCQLAPKCYCTFGSETVAVEEQAAGSEALAGAVGALGSALLTGGGFSIWYLIRGRKPGGDIDGADGDDVDSSSVKRGPPPYHTNAMNSRNIYSAGIKDDLTHKVSNIRRTGGSAVDF